MALREVILTDEQWERIEPHIPKPAKNPKGGRPWAADRRCLEGILWVAKSGARWKDLPAEFPSPATCWRRLDTWEEMGVFKDIWRAFLDELDEQALLAWDEVFADGTFAPAKKGGATSERPRGERARSGWWWAMAAVFLWEYSLPVRRRRRSRSSSRRSRR